MSFVLLLTVFVKMLCSVMLSCNVPYDFACYALSINMQCNTVTKHLIYINVYGVKPTGNHIVLCEVKRHNTSSCLHVIPCYFNLSKYVRVGFRTLFISMMCTCSFSFYLPTNVMSLM